MKNGYLIFQILISVLFMTTIAEDKWIGAVVCIGLVYLAEIAKKK